MQEGRIILLMKLIRRISFTSWDDTVEFRLYLNIHATFHLVWSLAGVMALVESLDKSFVFGSKCVLEVASLLQGAMLPWENSMLFIL